MGEKKTKNVVIIALCLTLIFMGVGFAALSQNINISATGTVAGSDAWDVHYSAFALNGTNGTASDTTPAGDPNKYLDSTSTTATVSFTLTAPGDYVEYKGTIKNFGSIDAKLATYTSTFDTDNEYVQKTITIGGSEIATGSSNAVTSPSVTLTKGAATGSDTEVVVRYTFKDVANLPASTQTVSDTIAFGFVQD